MIRVLTTVFKKMIHGALDCPNQIYADRAISINAFLKTPFLSLHLDSHVGFWKLLLYPCIWTIM